jgi:uncharacterized protein (TIGR02246 family)
MRSLCIALALLAYFSTTALAAPPVALPAADEQAIKDRVNEFQAAWNKDDTKAMAAVWAEDGSLINPVGDATRGQAEMEKIFVAEHTGRFKATTYTTSEVSMQSVTPDVAVVDVTANISGVRGPDGAAAPDYLHHVVWVFVKKDGNWLAAAARPYKFEAKPGAEKKNG